MRAWRWLRAAVRGGWGGPRSRPAESGGWWPVVGRVAVEAAAGWRVGEEGEGVGALGGRWRRRSGDRSEVKESGVMRRRADAGVRVGAAGE